MHTPPCFAAAFSLAVFLMAGPVQAAPAVDIRQEFTPGQVTRYRTVNETDMRMPAMGAMGSRQVQTTVQSQKTLSNDGAGGGTMEMTIQSLKSEQHANGATVVWDSTSGEAPADRGMQIQARLVGRPITVTFDGKGRLKAIAGVDALLDEALAGADVPAEMRQTFSQGWSRMFEGVSMMLPGRPVQVGDTWGTPMEIPLPILGTMVADFQEKLVAVEGTAKARVAVIEIGGTITLRGDAAGLPGLPPELKISTTIDAAKVTGEMRWSVDAGRLLQSRTTMDMTMSMTIGGPDGRSQTQVMQMTQVAATDLLP